MLFMVLNLVLSVIIMYLIGWQIRQRAFPFRSWRGGGPKTGWDWINLLFVVYNLYAITTTWMSLGVLTLYGVLYLLVMVIALTAGLEGPAMKDFINQAKAYGFKSAVDQWRRMHKK